MLGRMYQAIPMAFILGGALWLVADSLRDAYLILRGRDPQRRHDSKH